MENSMLNSPHRSLHSTLPVLFFAIIDWNMSVCLSVCLSVSLSLNIF